jgi:hypothetical protein
MLKKTITISLLITLVLFTSCAIKTGQDFNTTYISKIKRGKTTKNDMQSNIGPPTSVTTTSEGESWRYSYTEGGNFFQNIGAAYGASAVKNNQKLLVVIFDGDVVKDYKYTQGELDPASMLGNK